MLPPIHVSSVGGAERLVRDVVALSTLPALWLGADPVRIVESLAAALFAVLEADLVYVSFRGDESVCVAQTGRHRTDAALAHDIELPVLEWARTHDPGDLLALSNVNGSPLLVMTRPLGIEGEFGAIAAGFRSAAGADDVRQLLLNLAATQATLAVQNWRAMREAQRSRMEAEAASRAKDEFLAMLGHELRNPLAPIHTALQLMRLRSDVGAERERGVIERQVAHLMRLVDDLLDVARITRGKIELRRSRVDLADVVAKGIEMASPLLELRRHTLHVQVRRGLEVDGDLLRLAQVTANLLNNAAKYTETGGLIQIAARKVGDRAELQVRDNGIGIPTHLQSKVFDLFVRGDPQQLDRAQGGLGLGLAIVRSLVTMHGGAVSVRSEGPSRGSEFIVTLPLTTPTVGPSGEALAERESESADAQSILVVDDNEDAADMLADALRTKGHQVYVAHDGAAALRIFSAVHPVIAFLDIGLPVMDGYELAMRLRRLAGGDALRLVAVTGYGREGDRRRAQAAGFDTHLVKPVDLAVVERLVQSCRT